MIGAGGTGGHIYPAIAVAQRLQQRIEDCEILFVGAYGRMEMEKVPAAGFRIEGLHITGLQRKLTWSNVIFPLRLVRSLIRAASVIRRFRPDVVVGFGGFASGPPVYMAARKGIPTVIQEQNSFPGITSRILAKRVRRICVAYEGMEKFFPAEKIRITGNPVRQDLHRLETRRNETLAYFGLDPDRKTLLLFGGSLGARTLNEAMRAGRELLSGRDDIQVLWQMGKLYAEEFGVSETAQLAHVHPLEFIDRMDLAYAAADVVICRAGASTISELAVAGKAAVLVPSPNVAEDHQTHNALALVRRDAAVLVRDVNAAGSLLDTALEILRDEKRRIQLQQKIRQFARPGAADHIVDEIMNVAGHD